MSRTPPAFFIVFLLILTDTFRKTHPEEQVLGTGHGFPGKKDGSRIDYIFVSAGDEVLDARIVYYNQDGFYPSDHFPVAARILLVFR